MTIDEWKATSVGGDHYRSAAKGGVQPIDLILSCELPWLEGEVIAAVARWRHKNGIADIHKAIGLLKLLVSQYEDKTAEEQAKPGPIQKEANPIDRRLPLDTLLKYDVFGNPSKTVRQPHPIDQFRYGGISGHSI